MNYTYLLLEAQLNFHTFIHGENHTLGELKLIEKSIIKHEPDFFLSEALGPHRYMTNEEIVKGKRSKNYIKGFNDWDFELGLRLDIPIIGIDLWLTKAQNKDKVKSFKLREAQMLKVIKEFHGKGSVCVVLGDTHLRTIETDELGPVSPITAYFKSQSNATIIRSDHGEIK